ncbi:MAG TPA: BadF/BadG/BcrA/BcrD ATPase family protein [Bryobacteraceae bacterium]|nr:BadF/BadG/BcrA/BcrD ATPase family protein [Bryobacteraceae bacterium]
MKYFLGIDGGQSSTTALIGDESGRIVGRGAGGPCNHATAEEGRGRLERAIEESVGAARAQAGLDAGVRFAAACCGMSGGPEDKRAILEGLLPADKLIVTNDAAIALAGATPSGRGIIVIAGTGSMAFARNQADQTARAGGWGYLFGDEGSAYDIARQALRAALRMEEGWGAATVLRNKLLAAGGAADANELMHRFYAPDWPRDRIAMLAPLVNAAAEAGDAVAAEILQYAALQLAMLASAVRPLVCRAEAATQVAFAGGVFRSRLLRERFRELVELEPRTECTPALRSPAEGALLEAMRAAGFTAPES